MSFPAPQNFHQKTCPHPNLGGQYIVELMDDDQQLLTAYARDGSEEAFSTLAHRYLDLVYSAAIRQLGDADKARDVAQAVFLLLAHKAKSLPPETILSGWLYRTARFVSMEAHRAEKRRKLREETMARAIQDDQSSEAVWNQVLPHLDDAMAEISESDRTAIILRYFEDRPLREVGAILGLNTEAAKKKVSRALEKLRLVLDRKGIHSTSSLLGTALLASAVQPTPSAVAAVMVSSLGAPAAILPAQLLVKGTIEMITFTKIQAGTTAALILLLAGGTGYVGVQRAEALREISQSPRSVAESVERPAEPSSPQDFLAQAKRENQQLQQQALELYRLRDAVTQLGDQVRFASTSPNTLNLHHAPPQFHASAEKLRELQYERFMAAGLKAMVLQPLSDDERDKYAFEINFLKNVGLALRIYASDNGDQFPPSIDTLLANDYLEEKMEQQLQTGKYEYITFTDAESKPGLPAVWWRVPDEKGVRIVAQNDGSVQIIREPVDLQKPGYLALTEQGK